MKRLNDKTVLITGAGRGIGRALALAFAREGSNIIICSRSSSELEPVAQEVRALGARVLAKPCDVSVSSQVSAFVAAGVKEFRQIDVLINNAGILGPIKPLVEVSDAEWKAVLAANLDSVFFVTREVLRSSMRPRGKGCVINISSGQGRKASANWGPYAASKFGLEGLTKAWTEETRDRGIRFYSVNPTATRTAMRAEAVPGENPSSLKSPETVVEAFLTLAGDDCKLPTGTAAWLNRESGRLES
jgi:NAD(P)-dependent dehydrogenase (short-subunit alcohol dehydrogenase family)